MDVFQIRNMLNKRNAKQGICETRNMRNRNKGYAK